MASKIVGLDTQLTWAMFRVKNAPPPGDDIFGDAALTQAQFNLSGINLVPVDPGRSRDLKLEDKIVVTITLNPAASWVASWVKQRPAAEQTRLLKHEQGHYDLVALLARDCFEELMPLREKVYTDGADLQSDVDAITQRFAPKSKPVQDAYDDETDHGAKQPDQDKWNRLIRSAESDDTNPAVPGVNTPIRKKPLLDVLKAAGINIT